jgi:hypothetical protein
MARGLVVLVFALSVLGSQEDGVLQDRKDFIPDREHPLPVAPGRHVMALVTQPLTLVDPSLVRPGDHSLVLSSSGGAYAWCYFMKDSKPGPRADVENVLEFGVTRSHSLVEVETRERQGSPSAGPSLLVTSMKVVDNSKEFPLRPHKVIAELRAKYEAYLKDLDKEIGSSMERTRQAAGGDAPKARPPQTASLLYVTWMEETEKLQVRFFTRVQTTDGIQRAGRSNGEAPPPMVLLFWGIDFGMLYEVSKSGTLEKRLKLPIEGWKGPYAPKPLIDWSELVPPKPK